MRSLDLTGKVALLTGATGALGSALSMAFADAGADLVISSRTKESLDDLAASIVAATGRRVAVVPADLYDGDAADALAEEAWRAFGHLDIVVCNAAPVLAAMTTGTAVETSDDDWHRMQDLILWSVVRLLRKTLPRMSERGSGCVLTVGSSSGSVPVSGLDAYGIAKGGLELLTRYLAKEWGRQGIRVNCVTPAAMVGDPAEEDRVREMLEANGLLARVSLGRLSSPADVVGPALFLVSDHAAYLTGEILSVDGGRF